MSESESVELDEPEEENDVVVVDPDDYQKTKKLEIINRCKKDVLKMRRNRHSLILDLGESYRDDGGTVYQRKLAQSVAQYGTELLPLIEEGYENETLQDADVVTRVDNESMVMSVIQFIEMDGQLHREIDGVDCLPEANTMEIYRQLERIQRKLGLGLDLQEEKGPAEI